MKYSIKVNEVRAKEGSNIKGFATLVFGDVLSKYILKYIPYNDFIHKLIRTRESFLYQCLDTAPMSVMKAMV